MQLTSRSAGRAEPKPAAELQGKPLGSLGGPVPDRIPRGSRLPQRPDGRPCAAAGAEDLCARRRAVRSPSAAIRPGASVFSAAIAPSAREGQRVGGSDRSRSRWPPRRAPARPLVRDRHVGARRSRRPRARAWSARTAPAARAAAGSASRSGPAPERRVVDRRRAAVGHRPAQYAQPAHHFFVQVGG